MVNKRRTDEKAKGLCEQVKERERESEGETEREKERENGEREIE